MKASRLGVLLFAALLLGAVGAGAESIELITGVGKGEPVWGLFPAVSSDGKWATFAGDPRLTNENAAGMQIYVRNLETGYLELISVAPNGSAGSGSSLNHSSLSADGRFVVFETAAGNLATGDDNGSPDIFLRDRLTGTTEVVNVDAEGRIIPMPGSSSHPCISADGRFVTFHTTAKLVPGNLSGVNIYLWDRLTKSIRWIAYGLHPTLSGDGRFLAYKAALELRVLDLETGATEVVSRTNSRYIPGNPYAYIPAISADGRFVAYEGWAAETAPLSTEVFVYDRLNRTNRQITCAYDGSPLTSASGNYVTPLKPRISGNGRYVVFFSSAADLVQGVDGNQLYLYDLVDATMRRLPIDNLYATVMFPWFDISGDGARVVFQDSAAAHLTKSGFDGCSIFGLNTGIGSLGAGSDTGGIEIVAEPAVLWPPTGKLTDVRFSVTAPGASRVEIRIEDEYGVGNQTVHGTSGTVQLEAWRAGDDMDGRTYTVTAVAFDAQGEETTAATTVSVPHDRR